MKIAIGADSEGLGLKDALKRHLKEKGHACVDVGGSLKKRRPYYEVAHDLAARVGSGGAERGVLICGTGTGMAVVANKHPGVFAAACEDPSAAALARSINNANVLALGGWVTAPRRAKEIVDAFLKTEFKSGWPPEEKAWLDKSMTDIRAIEASEFRSRGSRRNR